MLVINQIDYRLWPKNEYPLQLNFVAIAQIKITTKLPIGLRLTDVYNRWNFVFSFCITIACAGNIRRAGERAHMISTMTASIKKKFEAQKNGGFFVTDA